MYLALAVSNSKLPDVWSCN